MEILRYISGLVAKNHSWTLTIPLLDVWNGNFRESRLMIKHSQIRVNDHLWITATCIQRPPFQFLWHATSEQQKPLNNGHKLWVTRVVFENKFNCSLFVSVDFQISVLQSKCDIQSSGLQIQVVFSFFCIECKLTYKLDFFEKIRMISL